MFRILAKHSKKLLTGLAVVILLAYFTVSKIPSEVEVHFLDIGQGDSVLIVTPELRTVLIDGGPGETVLEEIGDVLPFFSHDIDFMILTHPHRDHIEGLVEVLKRYRVQSVILAGDAYHSSLYKEFLKVAREKEATGGLKIYFADSESDFKIPTGAGDLLFDVLHPLGTVAGRTYENTNNASIVVKMSMADSNAVSFLFTGDCEEECEHEILAHYPPSALRADVLKIGHHGSRTSTTQAFLTAVSPRTAVIQSGVDNQFAHPHPETLEKLKNANVEIRRNDLEGRVTIQLF